MEQVASSAGEARITPFWQRIPLFFRYPLHPEPLLYILLLAAASLLAFVLPVPAPFDLLIVLCGVWLAFIRYAYKTLEQTARGLLTPDRHELHADPERAALPYKQFAVFLCMGVLLGVAGAVGGLALGAATVFTMLALPASVMILALTRSFRAAVNPFALVGMMRAIGLPYLGLCAFLMLLSASQEILAVSVQPLLPPWLLLPAFNFVAMYFTLIMFNMMGYVVYQYHHLLGVSIKADAIPGSPEGDADAIGRLVGEGRIDDALEVAYEAQRVAPDDLAAHGRYHKLLALAGRQERMLSHGRRYLTLLLQKGMGDDALALHRRLQETDAAFRPERPEELLRLAEAARRGRDFAGALALIKGFDKRFPRHAEIPSVYLFAARVLCENLRQDASAQRILDVLVERYPEHPASIEARQLSAVLARLSAPVAAVS